MSKIDYSIVIPTFKEAPNIRPLVCQICEALKDHGYLQSTEIIIVDDNSKDGTEGVVKDLSKEGLPVRVLVRTTEKGLSSAVLHGFNNAKGNVLLCMDADLQHPPAKVPEFFDKFKKKETEFVLGTRYGGKEFAVDKDWPLYRKVISQGARALARPLSPLSDPMSGFFALRKDVFKRAKNVNSVGFKIALELYVKAKVKNLAEVPIHFGLRTAGESKLTGKVMLSYTQHLHQLYNFQYGPLFYVFLFLLVLLALFIASRITNALF